MHSVPTYSMPYATPYSIVVGGADSSPVLQGVLHGLHYLVLSVFEVLAEVQGFGGVFVEIVKVTTVAQQLLHDL